MQHEPYLWNETSYSLGGGAPCKGIGMCSQIGNFDLQKDCAGHHVADHLGTTRAVILQ